MPNNHQSVPVAARSKAWVLLAWILGPRLLIPLKAWIFVLCCTVVRWHGPCDGLIPLQGVLPNVELIHNFERNSELEQVTQGLIRKADVDYINH
jgi:hypothetical protein